MVERLTITAMGKLTVQDRIFDAALRALQNLALDSSDVKRAAHIASAIMYCGEHQEFNEHGSWQDRASHQ